MCMFLLFQIFSTTGNCDGAVYSTQVDIKSFDLLKSVKRYHHRFRFDRVLCLSLFVGLRCVNAFNSKVYLLYCIFTRSQETHDAR